MKYPCGGERNQCWLKHFLWIFNPIFLFHFFCFVFNSIEEVVNCLPYSLRSIDSMVHSLKHFWFQYFCTFLSIIKPSLVVCISVYFYINYSALRKLYDHLQYNKSLKFCFILPMIATLLFFFNIYEHKSVHLRSLNVFSPINFLWNVLESNGLKIEYSLHANFWRLVMWFILFSFSAGGFFFLSVFLFNYNLALNFQYHLGYYLVLLIWTCWGLSLSSWDLEYKLFHCPLNELEQFSTAVFPSYPVY